MDEMIDVAAVVPDGLDLDSDSLSDAIFTKSSSAFFHKSRDTTASERKPSTGGNQNGRGEDGNRVIVITQSQIGPT
jgi:hypothetical protein